MALKMPSSTPTHAARAAHPLCRLGLGQGDLRRTLDASSFCQTIFNVLSRLLTLQALSPSLPPSNTCWNLSGPGEEDRGGFAVMLWGDRGTRSRMKLVCSVPLGPQACVMLIQYAAYTHTRGSIRRSARSAQDQAFAAGGPLSCSVRARSSINRPSATRANPAPHLFTPASTLRYTPQDIHSHVGLHHHSWSILQQSGPVSSAVDLATSTYLDSRSRLL